MRHILLILFTLFVIIPSSSEFSGEPIVKNVEPPNLALLIGINEYKANITRLYGALNDLDLMTRLLTTKNFLQSTIVRLENKDATKARILSELKLIVERAKPGSQVVVYFSGHGSKVRDDEDDEEIDHMDETILPYDYERKKNRERPTSITDDELSDIITAIANKGALLTLILDSCHSGGSSRLLELESNSKTSAVRYVEALESPDLREQKSRTFEKVDMDGKIDRYILLSACRSDEKAREVTINRQSYGIFTLSLTKLLALGDTYPSWSALSSHIVTDVQSENPYQTPQIVGANVNYAIFGKAQKLYDRFITLSRISKDNFTMDIGEIFGVTKGTILEVFPIGTLTKDQTEAIGKVSITETLATQSQAKTIEGTLTAQSYIARISTYQFPNSVLPIRFSGPKWESDGARKLKENLSKLDWIVSDSDAPFLVLDAQSGKIAIRHQHDQSSFLQTFNVADPGIEDKVVAYLSIWARWVQLLDLKNPSPSLNFSVDVSVSRSALSASLEPDYIIEQGNAVSLKIRNNSDHKIYISFVNLMDNGGIDAFSLGQLLGYPTNEGLLPKTDKIFVIPTSVRPGTTENTDILKIFATETDIDLSFLRQNVLAAPKNGLDPNESLLAKGNGKWKRGKVYGWNTVQKVFLIKKE